IDGLWALAHAARARFSGPVIGLTGSAGKTSTKEFLGAYPGAFASPSSFNNFWGVPLTLCNASPDATLWVVEMGMNQASEIARLSELTQPTVALVVNVQPVHLEKLGSLEATRRAASAAERTRGAGVGSRRRPRCGGTGGATRQCRHHDRPRRRANRRRRHRDRRQF